MLVRIKNRGSRISKSKLFISGIALGFVLYVAEGIKDIKENPSYHDFSTQSYVEVQRETNESNESYSFDRFEDVYALVIVGEDEEKANQKKFLENGLHVYNFLKKTGASDDDIEFLAPPSSKDILPGIENIVDGESDLEDLESAVERLAKKCDENDLLFLYFSDHGDLFNGDPIIFLNKNEVVDAGMLKQIIFSSIKNYKLNISFFQCCFSGNFAKEFYGERRICISSSAEDKLSFMGWVNPVKYLEHRDDYFEGSNLSLNLYLALFDEASDENNDGKLSIREVVKYAAEKSTFSSAGKFPFNYIIGPLKGFIGIKQTPHVYYPKSLDLEDVVVYKFKGR